ncbi:MAG: hypothetical protein HRT36_02605 [Alphaproteobacteria bacterium]|nr:hypothetical protein [Alphaproteobacteria bacterium]
MSSEDLTTEEAQENQSEESGMPQSKPSMIRATGPVMILSMFLLLLAFFILLITMSTIDNQKRVAVFNSVAAAFMINREQQTELGVLINDWGNFEDKDFLDLQKELWLSLVPLAVVDHPLTGNFMELSWHSNNLFEPDTTNLKRNSDAMMRRLVSSMSNPAEGFRVQIIFHLGEILNVDIETALKQYFDGDDVIVEFQRENLNNDIYDPRLYFRDIQHKPTKAFIYETNPDTLQYARALSMAYSLEKAGAEPRKIMVGIQEGVRDTIQIRYNRFSSSSDATQTASWPKKKNNLK